MKADKVREIDSAELQTKLQESEEQMFRLRFQLTMGQTEGIKKYRELRKDRARMLTIISERRAKGEVIAPPVPKKSAKPAAKKAAKPAAAKKTAAKPAVKKAAAKTAAPSKAVKKGSK